MVDTSNSKSIKFMFASNRCPLVFVCVDMCAVIVFFFQGLLMQTLCIRMYV